MDIGISFLRFPNRLNPYRPKCCHLVKSGTSATELRAPPIGGRGCLYSLRCREGVFPEIQLPAYGVPGNSVAASQGFPDTHPPTAVGLERMRNDATMAPMPPTSMNPPKTNGRATTPINGLATKIRPKTNPNTPKIPAPQPPPWKASTTPSIP